MPADSTVHDILKEVDRFRILCAGRSGVGKSSIINRVFGLQETPVEPWKVGQADIERGITSHENQFFVLHDSMGFESGEAGKFDIVSNFVSRRCDKNLPLKERLHAVWLCTESPTAGGRVFESGDEKLLRLAHETETPVVIVFTKYDRLVRSKQLELKGDQDASSPVSEDVAKRSKVEAQKVMDSCIKSLESAKSRLHTQKLNYAKVSIIEGYEADISSLVKVTRDVVQERVIWAIAQRVNLPLKIDACIKSMGTEQYRRFLGGGRYRQMSLQDCLAEIHQDIITCWNFKDEDEILSGNGFKQLMLYLVQDVHESENYSESHKTSSPTIGKTPQFLSDFPTSPTTVPPLETTSNFAVWLKGTAVYNAPKVRLLLTTYIVDLTTVLKSLFEITLRRARSPGKTTWLELKEAFEGYETSGSHQRIHGKICRKEQQGLHPDSFEGMFSELVRDPVLAPPSPPPVPKARDAQNATSHSTQGGTSSSPLDATREAPSGSPSPRRRIRLPCICV